MAANHSQTDLGNAIVDLCCLLEQSAAHYLWFKLILPKLPFPDAIEYQAVQNALLDSYLLSVRVLDDFFRSVDNQDDILAKHYGYDIRSILTSDQRIQINKRVAHLTPKRSEKEEWSYGPLKKAAEEVEAFLAWIALRPQFIPAGFDLSSRRELCEYLREEIP